ncbi:MAG: glycosyltransferase, partial [Butyrivibrio sp.]|nr:glycosyltransferase [Butyrivibrio sp.]
IKRVAVAYLRELRNEELLWSLYQAGFDVQVFEANISVYSVKKEDAQVVSKYIEANVIDAFFTYDFCPAVSDGCNIKNIPYFAWVYDFPLSTLYEKAIANPCNYIFSFDRIQTERIRTLGAKNVRHQPLGTNMFRNSGTVITAEDEKEFSCNISFVGNLMSDELYMDAERVVSEATRNEYKRVISDAYGIWDGKDRIHNALSKAALDELIAASNYYNSWIKMPADDYFATNLITYTLARRERIEMVERLAKYNIQFFTRTEGVQINGVTPRPGVNQIDELPKVYYLSKINLNLTMHTILSGIPLRVFDIMGVGGFVLSNYQPEIEELFKIDEEIVVFHSFEEMEDKVRYYLEHERQRLQICINGYNAVKERFDNEKIIRRMIEETGLNRSVL